MRKIQENETPTAILATGITHIAEANYMLSIINATIINEGRIFHGNIKVNGDTITEVAEGDAPFFAEGEVVDAREKYVIPGVIDEHVHFRQASLTDQAATGKEGVAGNIYTESRAAAAGGVTSFFDMPNTNPPTTTQEALEDKWKVGQRNSAINYAFFPGATNENINFLRSLDASTVPGIKVFMGASTGNMLVDNTSALKEIFSICAEKGLPVMTHCEDQSLITQNTENAILTYGEDPDVSVHSIIRNEEVCVRSTALALQLAEQTGARLLVAHVSTGKELDMILSSRAEAKAEVCVSYLMFCTNDYPTLHSRIKCNPALKNSSERNALRRALTDGRIWSIATDHAPHLLSRKQGGALKAASGMPSVQFSLPLMLTLADYGALKKEDVVKLMCHHPANFFGIQDRGFIRCGYKADLTIVSHLDTPHVITDADVLSLCGWTPYINKEVTWRVNTTVCNGKIVYHTPCQQAKRHPEQESEDCNHGERIAFNHDRRQAI